MAQRLIVRNRVGTGTSAGFYVDDISITTWSNSSPDVPLYCFSTGFEPVAAMRCTEYGYTTNP